VIVNQDIILLTVIVNHDRVRIFIVSIKKVSILKSRKQKRTHDRKSIFYDDLE
jgi:hypothetical protein